MGAIRRRPRPPPDPEAATLRGRNEKYNFWCGRRIALKDASRRVAWPERDESKLGKYRKLNRSGAPSKVMRRRLNACTFCIAAVCIHYAFGWWGIRPKQKI